MGVWGVESPPSGEGLVDRSEGYSVGETGKQGLGPRSSTTAREGWTRSPGAPAQGHRATQPPSHPPCPALPAPLMAPLLGTGSPGPFCSPLPYALGTTDGSPSHGGPGGVS